MSNRDWPEDAEHENGRYTCLCVDCGQAFIGHKRRVVCKDCAFASAPPSPDRYREGLEAAAKVAEKYDQNDFTVAGRFVIAAAIRSLTPPAPDASGGRDGAGEATQPEVLKFVREYICDGDSEEIAEYAGHLAAFINQRQTGKQDGAVEVSTYGNAAGHLAIKRAADALLREVADHLPKPDASGGRDGAGEIVTLREEKAEIERVQAARWDCQQRAIKRWQEAHPGQEQVWPDATDLLVWLMEQYAGTKKTSRLPEKDEAYGTGYGPLGMDSSSANRPRSGYFKSANDGAAEERARAVAFLREEARMRRRLLAEGPTAVVASYNRTRAIALDAAADAIESGDHLPKPGGSDE